MKKEFRGRHSHLKVEFGAYVLISGRARLPLSSRGQGSVEKADCFQPPTYAKGFQDRALRICHGRLIRSLLKPVHQRRA